MNPNRNSQLQFFVTFLILVGVVLITRLAFKLGDPDSILGRTSTQVFKIIEEEVLPLH